MARFISCIVVCVLSGSQLLYPLGWAMASDKPIASSPQPSSAISQKADKELATLRQNPEEFRTLVTGVQIFLGRFGYGVGPYTGQLDQATKNALKAYQKKTGLSETGDINFHTLKRLTEDDSVLSRIVPFLPAQVTRMEKWDTWVEVQGSWMLKEGNTDDVLRTSRISCMREFQRCIDSTASLVNASVPQLKVHTHVYDIKEWDDDKIVSFPYDGEACALSILRISKNPTVITRFVTLQGKPGICAKVKSDDRQYLLKDGQEIYQSLKMQKAKAIQQILQVAQ
jgi:hypothetical protein